MVRNVLDLVKGSRSFSIIIVSTWGAGGSSDTKHYKKKSSINHHKNNRREATFKSTVGKWDQIRLLRLLKGTHQSGFERNTGEIKTNEIS